MCELSHLSSKLPLHSTRRRRFLTSKDLRRRVRIFSTFTPEPNLTTRVVISGSTRVTPARLRSKPDSSIRMHAGSIRTRSETRLTTITVLWRAQQVSFFEPDPAAFSILRISCAKGML